VEVNGVQSCFVFHRRQSHTGLGNMRERSLIMIIFVPFSTVSFDLNELLNIQTVFIICIMIHIWHISAYLHSSSDFHLANTI